MGIAQTAVRSIRNIWSHGDEEEFERDNNDAEPYEPEPRSDPPRNDPRSDMRHDTTPRGGGGANGAGVRRVSPPLPLRATSRDKQIYTIKPHGLEEASAAADFLKTGSAVVVNLDDVDKLTAVRIIDFMSGVCYGLDAQGHAMKLGDTIFLFTPGDFEITSDEPDYNENQDFFFRDVPQVASAPALQNQAPASAPAPTPVSAAPAAPSPPSAEGPVIERTVISRPGAPATVERPAVAPRPWER